MKNRYHIVEFPSMKPINEGEGFIWLYEAESRVELLLKAYPKKSFTILEVYSAV